MTSTPKPIVDAYLGAEPYVFVSYAHADKERVYPQIARWHAMGHRIWYDPGIAPGTEWLRELTRALAGASRMIVFVSQNAAKSDYVLREVLTAQAPILAVHLEPSPVDSTLGFRLSDTQALFAYELPEASIDECVARFLREGALSPFAAGGHPRKRVLPYELPDVDRLLTFVGRSKELAAMEAVLRSGASDEEPPRHGGRNEAALASGRNCYVISGPSGVGKSLLAQKFALDAKGYFEAAVHIQAESADTMAYNIARSLHVDERELAAAKSTLRILRLSCARHRTILVIDNARDTSDVEKLLRALPENFSVVVTTQRRDLSLLSVHHADLDPLAEQEALALLAKLLKDESVRASEAARRICAAVGNLPQAIRLVATNCSAETLVHFADKYCDDEDRQRLVARGLMIDRRPFLAAIMDEVITSLEAFSPGIRHFYGCVTACDPAGFSVESASAAANCSIGNAIEMLEDLHLSGLIERAMLNRYAFHELFLAQARQLLSKTVGDSEMPHSTYWMKRLAAQDLSHTALRDELWLNRGDVALAGLRVAQRGALDEDAIIYLNEFFDRARLPGMAQRTFKAIVEWAESSQSVTLAIATRIRYAKVCGRIDARGALLELETIPALLESLPEGSARTALEIKYLVRRGALERVAQRPVKASGKGGKKKNRQRHSPNLSRASVETLERAVELARSNADPKQLRHAQNALASAYRDHCEFERALAMAESAYGNDDSSLAHRERFLGLRLIGDCLVDLGRIERAQSTYDACWQTAQTEGDRILLISHVLDVAQGMRDQARYSDAHAMVQYQIRLAGKLGSGSLFVRGLIVQGDICVKAKDAEGSLAAFGEVLKRVAELSDTSPVIGALRKLASDLSGSPHELSALNLAMRIAMADGDFESASRIHNRLGLIYAKGGRQAEAEREYQAQLVLARRYRLPLQEVYARLGLSNLFRATDRRAAVGAQGIPDEGLEYRRENEQLELAANALDLLEQRDGCSSRREVHKRRAVSSMHLGDRGAALKSLVEYHRALGPAQDRANYSSAIHNVARMLVKQMGVSEGLEQLRKHFSTSPDTQTAAVLAGIGVHVAKAAFASSQEQARAAHLLVIELLLASGECDYQHDLLTQLREVAIATPRQRPELLTGAITDAAALHSEPARVRDGFLATYAIVGARGLAPSPALLAAKAWALNCPILALQLYSCCHLGQILLQKDQLDEAEGLLRVAIKRTEGVSPGLRANALQSFIRLCQRRGALQEAFDAIARIIDWGIQCDRSDIVETGCNEAQRAFKQRGASEHVEAFWSRWTSDSTESYSELDQELRAFAAERRLDVARISDPRRPDKSRSITTKEVAPDRPNGAVS